MNRPARAVLNRVLLLPVSLLFAACATHWPSREPAAAMYLGELVPTERIPGDFLMRQQLHFRAGDAEGSVQVLIQKRCDELTVIGLTPFGTRAFTILQRGMDVTAESHVPVSWPFPPRSVLIDIHRVYFVPLPSMPVTDGVREIALGSEILEERWKSGRLVERSFLRSRGDPPGRIVITYQGGTQREAPASQVRLKNEWYGYDLEITTVSRTKLSCP